MSQFSQLQELGLGKTQIQIYVYLLEHGTASPPQISQGTGIQRTHCYGLLRELKERGLVQEQHGKAKRVQYFANDPQVLFHGLERQRDLIESLLPDLRGLYASPKSKPKIQFYTGPDEVKEVYTLSLDAKEVYGIGSTHQMQQRWPEFFLHYQIELKRRGIVYHDILTHASGKTATTSVKHTLKGLYEMKLLRPDEGDAPMDILIWSSHVGLISFDEPIFGTVITNTAVEKMFLLLFRALWKRM